MTVNGTSTAYSYLELIQQENFLPYGEYIISGIPLDVPSASVSISIGVTDKTTYVFNTKARADKAHLNVKFTVDDTWDNKYFTVRITVDIANITFNNVVFYPMIRYASDIDDTWQSYTPSNKAIAQNVKDFRKDQAILGVKNLIPYPYAYNLPKTVGNITFSDIGNGAIGVNSGAVSSYTSVDLCNESKKSKLILPVGDYIISCNAYDAFFASSQFFAIWYKESSQISGVVLGITSKSRTEAKFSITQEIYDNVVNGNGYLLVRLVYDINTSIDNDVVFYPMIRLASDYDDTWQPYAPTNYQLNQKLDTIAGVYLPNVTNANSKKVVASVGQTSVTFDANSFMTQYNVTASDLDLDISAETASGDVVAYNNVSVTGGIVTVTFDALAEQTTFICKCSVIQ